MPVCARNQNFINLRILEPKLNSVPPVLTKIRSIMETIKKARNGFFRSFSDKKLNFSDIHQLLPKFDEFNGVAKETIYFYYRLLSCMENNFNDLFKNEYDYDIFMKYCDNIKELFYNNNSSTFRKNLVESYNFEGKSRSTNKKQVPIKLSDQIKKPLTNKLALEKNVEPKYNNFITATSPRLLNQDLTAKTNKMLISGIDPSIYKFGALVNQKTVINTTKINKEKGFLMRDSDYEKLSQSQKKLFLNTVRSKRFAVGNENPNTENLTSDLRKNLNTRNSILSRNEQSPIASQG